MARLSIPLLHGLGPAVYTMVIVFPVLPAATASGDMTAEPSPGGSSVGETVGVVTGLDVKVGVIVDVRVFCVDVGLGDDVALGVNVIVAVRVKVPGGVMV